MPFQFNTDNSKNSCLANETSLSLLSPAGFGMFLHSGKDKVTHGGVRRHPLIIRFSLPEQISIPLAGKTSTSSPQTEVQPLSILNIKLLKNKWIITAVLIVVKNFFQDKLIRSIS
jgi:hypothetical protein